LSRRLIGLVAALVATAAVCVPAATASRFIKHGIFDDAQIHYGDPDEVFPMLRQLRSQMLRINMQWGGTNGVAKRRPVNPTNPNDPAYNWSVYDRTVNYAQQYGQQVVFAIMGTPPWANRAAGLNVAPTNPLDLQRFAAAAARRYSGTFEAEDGRILPAVRWWLAWNEPNTPVFLRPQFRRVRGRYVIQSAINYAKICNAIVKGISVSRVGAAKVGCGVTAPRGNNNPNTSRASVSPLAFLRAMHRAGATGFDAYAHHPYYGKPSETPSTPPPRGSRGQDATAVTLGNINTLVSEVTRLWGRKRIWISEYGYQTKPPDPIFGVSLANQARYLTQAYGIARRHPRIDMFLWFLLRDEKRAFIEEGWQSGLLTDTGRKKPAFAAFQRLRSG
jgi:Glycosyl hydrolase catalytic core